MNPATQDFVNEQIRTHVHDGNNAMRVNFQDIFLYTEPVHVNPATIATTGNTDAYFLAPRDMSLIAAYFSGTDALATSDTNYITFSITNLGLLGSDTDALLEASNANTTKTTGGTALSANTRRTLTLNTTVNNLQVTEGERIRVRCAATGTLAGTVTFPAFLLLFR